MPRRENGQHFLERVVRGRRRVRRTEPKTEDVPQWKDVSIAELEAEQADRETPQQGESYWEFLARTDFDAFVQLPRSMTLFPPMRAYSENADEDKNLRVQAERRMNRYFGKLFYNYRTPRRPRRTNR